MSRITVQLADPGRRVPVEGQRGVYFQPGVPRPVADSPYYQRRLADKDLVMATAGAGQVETAIAAAEEPSDQETR